VVEITEFKAFQAIPIPFIILGKDIRTVPKPVATVDKTEKTFAAFSFPLLANA
jgi:hypothetical protein